MLVAVEDVATEAAVGRVERAACRRYAIMVAPLATIRSLPPLPLAATAILDFGGDFGMILGIFGGNFGFRWQFWEVSAIFRWQFWEVLGNFRWQFWENCLFLQCNNERQSLRGDNKAKGYHCAKIIK